MSAPRPIRMLPRRASLGTWRTLSAMVHAAQHGTGHDLGHAGNGRYIRIVEVSPRDGLQNLPPPAVSTEIKRELIERLLLAGLKNVEVGSFVRPDRVPQMSNTATLLPTLPSPSSHHTHLKDVRIPDDAGIVHYPVLIPNKRGLDTLLSLEAHARENHRERLTDEIAMFVSATEEFSRANNGASVEKVLASLPSVVEKALANGYRVRGYVSCVMSDPYAGKTDPRVVVPVVRRLLNLGCYEVSLGDTTGEGNPEAWRVLWRTLQSAGVPMHQIAAHCHDTFSMALPSILALLPLGLRTIDSSLAGLGGCPYSPGATGNVPTEDVVYALHEMGYQTGVDLDKLVEAGNWVSEVLGVRNESRVGRAMWARRRKKDGEEGSGI
ncbi:hydroxymethylglutaryl-CoA lyase [Tremella mesenterica]|uniref:hydroxymethylglutaryl-CoA lyase n=1 Tax=Tremella mesenterica TaxID=5217 RepID=A0A4Q1BWP5_TREME|nr:hydroxymethylglutaryl-CoA lyase [Tremella mesenterica]